MTTLVGRSLGRYKLDKLLGQGGMAQVYRATDTKLARSVAVKVILATHANEPQFLERFLREARVVASLEHPNILPVYDFGEEDGIPFLVMPYLEGGTLRDRMTGMPVEVGQAASWIRQLALALDAAHEAGVLHRDVKPANVLIGRGDRLALADFGIAKMLETMSGLTATGVVVGTPLYMAPEQAQGKPASPATDRYALAVIAYELLAGSPPFEGENPLSLMHQHVTTPAPGLSTKVRGLAAGLDAVFARALAKDPGERPPTCLALADAVAAYLPTAAMSLADPAALWAPPTQPRATAPTLRQARPASPPASPAPVRVAGSATPPGLTSDQTVLTNPPRGRRVVLGALALGVVAVAAAALVMVRRANAPAPVPTPAPTAAATAPAPTATAAGPPPMTVVEVTPVPPRIPPPPGSGNRGVPEPPETPEGPLAAVLRRLDPAHKPDHRVSKEDFEFALGEARRVLRQTPNKPEAKYLETYALGGLDYVAGRDTAAARAIVEAMSDLPKHGRREARQLGMLVVKGDGTMGPPTGWQLALAYGDARGEAGELLEREMAEKPTARTYLGRATLHRMQGRDDLAVADAKRAWEMSPRPAVASGIAEFLGDESARAGSAEEAVSWYRQALKTPGPATGAVAMRAGRISRDRLGKEADAREFFGIACRAGNVEGCKESGETPPAASDRSRRRFPK